MLAKKPVKIERQEPSLNECQTIIYTRPEFFLSNIMSGFFTSPLKKACWGVPKKESLIGSEKTSVKIKILNIC